MRKGEGRGGGAGDLHLADRLVGLLVHQGDSRFYGVCASRVRIFSWSDSFTTHAGDLHLADRLVGLLVLLLQLLLLPLDLQRLHLLLLQLDLQRLHHLQHLPRGKNPRYAHELRAQYR